LLIAYGLIAGLRPRHITSTKHPDRRRRGFRRSRRLGERSRRKDFRRKDAGQIVIDEVFGQIISFVFIAPYLAGLGANWRWWMIAGLALFRAFDILNHILSTGSRGCPAGLA